MIRTSLAALLLLSACGDEASEAQTPKQSTLAAPAAAPAQPPMPSAPPPTSQGRAVVEKTDDLEFTYGWSAEAAAIAPLNTRFERELVRDREEALAMAREDKAARPPELPFNGHFFSKKWTSYGSTPALLSLAAQTETFTGGAHGSASYEGLIWDREAERQIGLADLFSDPAAADALMREPFCRSLAKEQAQRRGEPTGGPFDNCPSLSDLVVVPLDRDGGGFDAFQVLIAPYEAGSWAEGVYKVEIDLTEPMRALIKDGYAASF